MAWLGAIGTILLAIHWILGTIAELTGNKTVNGIDAVLANIIKAVFQRDTTIPK
jgi:hypothetical protein